MVYVTRYRDKSFIKLKYMFNFLIYLIHTEQNTSVLPVIKIS